MSSRLACWISGHKWGTVDKRIWEDLFGNEWRLQFCDQCSAHRRRLQAAWSEVD